MRAHAAQALKEDNHVFNIDDFGTRQFAGGSRAVRLCVSAEEPGELHPKEIICCIMATD